MSKRNQILHEILDVLSEGGRLISEWMENPHALRRRIRGTIPSAEWDKIFEDQRKNRTLQQIRKKEWIQDQRKGNEVVFILSNEAIVAYLTNSAISESQNNHTFETLVVFDIPEVARKARQHFRRLLKKFGFSQIQRSVWSSMNNMGQQMQTLVKILGIEKWVNVYHASLIDKTHN
ncbi:CRISPR-associated endonuclease Cas2 [Candidatus Uhrbacteria bacterium]|nr:CRISPR-associated endonuclease Cas2 [Candidatus Uhrbacteria bacterium]